MTPLVLVVGFLGAGKTTFLKKLIPALAARNIHSQLLINDYQNAKVDAEQFRDLIDDVRALSGNCVCCESRDQLLKELQGFHHGPGRVMIVETNGTTDSEQLIEALSLDPTLRQFTLPMQVSVVDMQRWQKRFWHNALERDQARTASHIFLSRSDTIEETRQKEVQESLHKLGAHGTFTNAHLFAKELATLAQNPTPARSIEHRCLPHEHNHDIMHAEHHFASCEFALPMKVSKKAFHSLLRNLPKEVIRAKGLVLFDENPMEFYVFQKVDHSDIVQFFPVGNKPKVNTPLALFIGPHLPIEDLKARIQTLV